MVEREHKTVGFSGRFGAGLPAINDGSLLFLQHMISKMHPYEEGDEDQPGSKIAIVFNGSPLFAGDAGSGPSNIRRWIIENDWLDAIVALPDQLFYNTGILTYVWLVTNRKTPERRGKVQLIDGTRFFQKMKKSLNNKRNEITEGQISHLTRVYGNYQDGETAEVPINGETKTRVISHIFENREFGFLKVTVERPLRMNFEATPERTAKLDEQTIFTNLATSKKRKDTAAAEREIAEGGEAAGGHPRCARDARRQRALHGPGGVRGRCDEGCEALRPQNLSGRSRRRSSRPSVSATRTPRFAGTARAGRRLTASFGTPRTSPCRPARRCPYPLDFGPDKPNNRLLETFRDDIDAYFAREVLPHVPDAWVDYDKTKVGYEIPINRHFYVYKPPRPIDQIEADITRLEGEIAGLLKGLVA